MFHQWLVTSSESLGFPGRYGHGPQRLRDSSRAAPTYLLHGTNDRVTTVVPSQRPCVAGMWSRATQIEPGCHGSWSSDA